MADFQIVSSFLRFYSFVKFRLRRACSWFLRGLLNQFFCYLLIFLSFFYLFFSTLNLRGGILFVRQKECKNRFPSAESCNFGHSERGSVLDTTKPIGVRLSKEGRYIVSQGTAGYGGRSFACAAEVRAACGRLQILSTQGSQKCLHFWEEEGQGSEDELFRLRKSERSELCFDENSSQAKLGGSIKEVRFFAALRMREKKKQRLRVKPAMVVGRNDRVSGGTRHEIRKAFYKHCSIRNPL